MAIVTANEQAMIKKLANQLRPIKTGAAKETLRGLKREVRRLAERLDILENAVFKENQPKEPLTPAARLNIQRIDEKVRAHEDE